MNNSNDLLIIGGSGFIGSHLANQAIKYGYNTTVLSLHEVDEDQKVSNVEYLVGDIRSLKNLEQLLNGRKIEYLINLSGYIDHSKFNENGQETLASHFGGVQNLIQCLDWNHLNRFIQIGSSDEYGNQPAPQNEDMREEPISLYSMGKVAASKMLQVLYITEGFPSVILRPFLVYGPGQNNQRFLPQIISGCLKNEKFPVSYGEQLRDFCYIDDIVEGIFKAIKAPAAVGEIINLASGQPVSIKKVIELVQKIIGIGTPQFGKVQYRHGENMALYADIRKAQEMLSWNPEVDLCEGLLRTIEYYKNDVT